MYIHIYIIYVYLSCLCPYIHMYTYMSFELNSCLLNFVILLNCLLFLQVAVPGLLFSCTCSCTCSWTWTWPWLRTPIHTAYWL